MPGQSATEDICLAAMRGLIVRKLMQGRKATDDEILKAGVGALQRAGVPSADAIAQVVFNKHMRIMGAG